MRETDAVEFYNLGLGEYHTISSINGSGTGDLLDAIVEEIPDPEEADSTKKNCQDLPSLEDPMQENHLLSIR